MTHAFNTLHESNAVREAATYDNQIPNWPDANAPCPLAQAFGMLGGRWKPYLLHMLRSGTQHFATLHRALPGVSRKVVVAHLRELQRDGLIFRTEYEDRRKRVLYALSDKGASLIPVLDSLYLWSQLHLSAVDGTAAKCDMQQRTRG